MRVTADGILESLSMNDCHYRTGERVQLAGFQTQAEVLSTFTDQFEQRRCLVHVSGRYYWVDNCNLLPVPPDGH